MTSDVYRGKESALQLRQLQRKSIEYRRAILRSIKAANAGHTAGSLSCIDILNVLYNYVMDITPENFASTARDRYIQSKGHSVEALYVVLADQGFFPESELKTLSRFQSHFVGHPTRKVSGIEHNTGALGHGLSVSVGLALGAKMSGSLHRVFSLLGDGELAEGSSWEALMAACHYELDNLVIIVDRNGLQITGATEDVMGLEPLAEKFAAFGCAVRSCDGNDVASLTRAFDRLPFERGKPNLLLARTVKGAGVSFMEDVVKWHHRVPADDEYQAALTELAAAESAL